MSKLDLPIAASDIFAGWYNADGGICAVASTDECATSFIGAFPLNNSGKSAGMPLWLRRQRIMSDAVVGFKDGRPIVGFIDIATSNGGIDLRITIPCGNAEPLHIYRSAKWGSPRPAYGYQTCPSTSDWPVSVYPNGVPS